MSLIEAQDLAFEIRSETRALAQLRQIGNGEWIVYVNLCIYIWNMEDWQRMKGHL